MGRYKMEKLRIKRTFRVENEIKRTLDLTGLTGYHPIPTQFTCVYIASGNTCQGCQGCQVNLLSFNKNHSITPE